MTEMIAIRVTSSHGYEYTVKAVIEAAGLDAAEYTIYINGVDIDDVNDVNDVKVKRGDLLWLYPKG